MSSQRHCFFDEQYRSLIKSSKPVYLISTKKEKTAISRTIVSVVRRANGRFLERSPNMDFYYDIGDAKAIEKTSQALREGQPKLRKRILHNRVDANDLPSSTKINPNSTCVRKVSYSSIDLNDIRANKIRKAASIIGQSLNNPFSDVKTIMNDRWLHQTNDRNQLLLPKNRTVTPPCTPPQLIYRKPIRDEMLGCTLPSVDIDANDFDDDNSIMTFDMDEDEMVNDDDESDSKSILPIPTPSQSLSSHFRTMNELKSNVPVYDKGSSRKLLSRVPSTTSPFINHLRALTELKDQIPRYPSCASFRDLQFDFSGANTAGSTLNATFPSVPISMQTNF